MLCWRRSMPKILSDEERIEALLKLKGDLPTFAALCLKVKDKAGRLVPFHLNRAQEYVHERLEEQRKQTGRVRALVLKGRQQGLSTLIAARYYHQCTLSGKSALIVAHEDKATANLFDMVKRYQEHNPAAPSTKASNAKELVFSALDCGYKLATAGTDDVGRGNTSQLIHGCLAGDTLVMMADGSLRQMQALEIGDMVRTRAGHSAPVSCISWHADHLRDVKVALNGIPIRATDNHKFWTRRGMVELRHLEAGDEVGFPVREITGEIESLPFAVGRTIRSQGGGREMLDVPESIDLTFDVGRMLGLYLAEGTVCLQSREPFHPSNVVFSCHERELDRNTGWVGVIPGISSINTRARKNSKTRVTVAYGRQFAEFVLRMCGRTAGKHLPHEWWRMPKEFVRGLLLGYLAGDGHSAPKRDRRIQAPSIHPAIAFGMRDVVAALGYGFPAVGFRDGAVRNGRNEKAQYTLRITGHAVDIIAPMLGWESPPRRKRSTCVDVSDGYAWLPIQSIEERQSATVWDIEVNHPDHDYCLTQCATSNSEAAFWRNPEKHMAGLGNTVADMDGTEIIMESTANGVGNLFHELWQAAESGKSDYIAIFVPWFWTLEYWTTPNRDFVRTEEEQTLVEAYGLNDGQLQWRRNKITSYGEGFDWLFRQEYPMCIAAGTRVGTNGGLTRIEDVIAGQKTAFGSVSASFSKGSAECVELMTAVGATVICTPDHKVLAEDGEFYEAKAMVGKRVALAAPMLADGYFTASWCETPSSITRITIDEDWGRLLGYFMGDGCMHMNTLSFACDAVDVDVVDDISGLINRLLGVASTRLTGTKKGCTEVRHHCVATQKLFDRLNLLTSGSDGGSVKRHVHVPDCIWASPKSVVREFLRGLFESDGCAYQSWNKVSLFSKDIGFLRDVHQLLLAFGVVAKIRSRPAKNGNGFEYQSNTIDLNREAAGVFHKEIGFVSTRKTRVVDEIATKIGRRPEKMEWFSEVVSVNPVGIRDVFDLTIPGEHRFDAGGIVVHNCAQEAYVTSTTNPLINPAFVMAAVNSAYRDLSGPLVIGVDPAGDGVNDADRTAIAFRRGRVVLRLEYHGGLNTMQIAGKVAQYAKDMDPAMIFVDKGGLGAGVYDRLTELGCKVTGVNSATAANESDKYENKRAEMWWRMRDWFADQPCRVPNNASLLSDLTGPQPKVSSNGRRLLEKKEDMKKRGLRSPDGGDALALTFAQPVLGSAAVDGVFAKGAATIAGY